MDTEKEEKDAAAQPPSEQPEEKPPVKIVPARAKIGEDRDNLRRRGEWFERRSGKQ